jgi:hypothetical protein
MRAAPFNKRTGKRGREMFDRIRRFSVQPALAVDEGLTSVVPLRENPRYPSLDWGEHLFGDTPFELRWYPESTNLDKIASAEPEGRRTFAKFPLKATELPAQRLFVVEINIRVPKTAVYEFNMSTKDAVRIGPDTSPWYTKQRGYILALAEGVHRLLISGSTNDGTVTIKEHPHCMVMQPMAFRVRE